MGYADREEYYERCKHNKVKLVDNGDWSWLECVKCGYQIPEKEEKFFVKKRKKEEEFDNGW